MPGRADVVKTIISNGKDQFLIVRDSKSGKWELPGGLIESGEDRFQAAKREIQEELGVKISDIDDIVRIELEDEKLVNCYITRTTEFKGEMNAKDDISDTK